MTSVRAALPPSAVAALRRGTLAHVAVATSAGPHLTPVVYVLDGGHIWMTTARRSVKARSMRGRREVAGLVAAEGSAVAFRGWARVFDALDPLSWPAAASAGPQLARAATRFSVKNARFFAGYALDARRVPLAWSPPGRVFVRITLDAGWVLEEERDWEAPSLWAPRGSWGSWAAEPARGRRSYRPLRRARSLDLGVPRDVRQRLGDRGSGALGLQSAAGLTVLPVAWRRRAGEGSYEAVAPTPLAGLAGAAPRMLAAMALERASAWRASEMAGLLLQGWADLFEPPATPSALARAVAEVAGRDVDASSRWLIRLRPSRVVWWRGWESGAVRER